MSARKRPGTVDQATDATVLEGDAIEATIDPELDRVSTPDVGEEDDLANGETADGADGADGTDPVQRKGRGKLVVGSALALAVAAGAVWAAGALGGSDAAGLPESVGDPGVVLAALEEGGIECTGAAISGQVATCNATMAVRLFGTPTEAEKWVTALLKDPQTTSSIGWVRHGNVVVAAPLNAAPGISAALGTGSQIY